MTAITRPGGTSVRSPPTENERGGGVTLDPAASSLLLVEAGGLEPPTSTVRL